MTMRKTGKLYFSYGTRGSKVLWLANLLGVELELEVLNLGAGEHMAPEYRAKNPHGTVPTLELEDGFCFWESAAIVHYLLDTYDPENELAGAPGSKQRNTLLNYNALANEAEECAIPAILHLAIYPEAMRKPEVYEAKKKRWEDRVVVFYKSLLDGRTTKFAVSDELMAVDVVIGYVLNIAERAKLLEGEPDLKAYVHALRQTEHFVPSFMAPENR